MDEQTDLLEYIAAYAKHLARGQSLTVPCPICKAELKISRNQDNGHLWVTCPGCGLELSS